MGLRITVSHSSRGSLRVCNGPLIPRCVRGPAIDVGAGRTAMCRTCNTWGVFNSDQTSSPLHGTRHAGRRERAGCCWWKCSSPHKPIRCAGGLEEHPECSRALARRVEDNAPCESCTSPTGKAIANSPRRAYSKALPRNRVCKRCSSASLIVTLHPQEQPVVEVVRIVQAVLVEIKSRSARRSPAGDASRRSCAPGADLQPQDDPARPRPPPRTSF